MKKTKKNGFTIVELVIVIAVIAILIAVLIPTFSKIIGKANQSNDTQVVRQLNTAIEIESVADESKRPVTMYDAIQITKDYGYDAAKIVAKSNLSIAWDCVKQRFVLLNENEGKYVFPIDSANSEEGDVGNRVDYFLVRNTAVGDNSGYSIYAGPNWSADEKTVSVSVGFDAGSVEGFTSVTYDRSTATKKQDVVIRTNSASTDIVLVPFVDSTDNTKGDHIEFYGRAGQITGPKDGEGNYTGFTVALNSLAINGETVGIMAKSGHVDLTNAVVKENEEIIILATTTDVKVSNPNKVATHAHATSSENANTMNNQADTTKKSVGVTWDYDNNEAQNEINDIHHHITDAQAEAAGENLGTGPVDGGGEVANWSFETAVEAVREEKVAEEIAEKQATCAHEYDEHDICIKCGYKNSNIKPKGVAGVEYWHDDIEDWAVDYFDTLEEAVSFANEKRNDEWAGLYLYGDYKLTQDIELTYPEDSDPWDYDYGLRIYNDAVLDLNNHTLKLAQTINVQNGKVTIKNGTILQDSPEEDWDESGEFLIKVSCKANLTIDNVEMFVDADNVNQGIKITNYNGLLYNANGEKIIACYWCYYIGDDYSHNFPYAEFDSLTELDEYLAKYNVTRDTDGVEAGVDYVSDYNGGSKVTLNNSTLFGDIYMNSEDGDSSNNCELICTNSNIYPSGGLDATEDDYSSRSCLDLYHGAKVTINSGNYIAQRQVFCLSEADVQINIYGGYFEAAHNEPANDAIPDVLCETYDDESFRYFRVMGGTFKVIDLGNDKTGEGRGRWAYNKKQEGSFSDSIVPEGYKIVDLEEEGCISWRVEKE